MYSCKYAFFTKVMPNNSKDYRGTTQHRKQLDPLSSVLLVCYLPCQMGSKIVIKGLGGWILN